MTTMIADVLTPLTQPLHAGSAWAGDAAFALGALGVWLSPCHVVGLLLFRTSSSLEGRHSAVQLRHFGVFLAVVLTTTTLLALATLSLGRLAGDTEPAGSIVLALVLVLAGLVMLDLARLPGLRLPATESRAGTTGRALAAGAAFSVGTGPCALAFAAPLVALPAALPGREATAWLLALFVAGHAVAMLSVWLACGWLTSSLDKQGGHAMTFLRHAAGAGMLGVAAYMLVRMLPV